MEEGVAARPAAAHLHFSDIKGNSISAAAATFISLVPTDVLQIEFLPRDILSDRS